MANELKKARALLQSLEGFTRDTSAHKAHTVMVLECDVPRKHSNCWISGSIELLCHPIGFDLMIEGNRCGPETFSTCDGPQERSYSFGPSIHRRWDAFDATALVELTTVVQEYAPQLLAAYNDQVTTYTEA